MAPVMAKMHPIRAEHEHIKVEVVLPPYKKEALSAERKLHTETLQRMDEIVIKICKARNIGLVIRSTVYSVDAADRASILQWVNKQIVYSNVTDLTDEVI